VSRSNAFFPLNLCVCVCVIGCITNGSATFHACLVLLPATLFGLIPAFIMAINEVNANPSILPNTNVKYIIRSGAGFVGGGYAASLILNNPLVKAAVGGVETIELQALQQALGNSGICMAHSMGK
jgi:Receptor family ligand binding region